MNIFVWLRYQLCPPRAHLKLWNSKVAMRKSSGLKAWQEYVTSKRNACIKATVFPNRRPISTCWEVAAKFHDSVSHPIHDLRQDSHAKLQTSGFTTFTMRIVSEFSGLGSLILLSPWVASFNASDFLYVRFTEDFPTIQLVSLGE